MTYLSLADLAHVAGNCAICLCGSVHLLQPLFVDHSAPESAVHALQAAAEAAVLKRQLNAIFEDMPRDLQQTMLSSPHRAALLQGAGPHPKVLIDSQLFISHPL